MKRRYKKSKGKVLGAKRLLILPVLLALAVFALYFTDNKYSADAVASSTQPVCTASSLQKLKNTVLGISPVCNSKLKIEVEKPFQSSPVAYPNGKDCVNVSLEAYTKEGTFLTNEPLVIMKPDAVTLNGPQTTDSGVVKWCVTSTKQIKARIIVKLKNLPKIQTSFTANFNPTLKITDETDRRSFFFNKPITFTAIIDPTLVKNLKSAQLVYTYNRRYNSWGKWKTRRQQVKVKLNCTEIGRCSAEVGGDNTSSKRIPKDSFSYSFQFVDGGGNRFSETFNGRLMIP